MAYAGVQIVRGYELRERIGAGGFGEVYRAYQPAVRREVAIKIILPEYANHPDFVRRFEVEAQLVARLEHIHIVPLYDYWREPGGAYLVMRWLRGGSLRARLAQAPLDLDGAARLLDQITAALNVAHRNGVVHRDLKPDNILLDEDCNAFLADFGIAKDIGVVEPGHSAGIIGSPAYLSPEQILDDPVTPQADLYSLGIVIYEILTGRRPFEDKTPTDLIRCHLYDPLPPLNGFRPDLPPALDEVIQKATDKNPAQRYGDAPSVAAAFRQAAQQAALIMPPPVAPGQSAGAAATPSDARTYQDTEEEPTSRSLPFVHIENPYKGLRAFQEADAADFFGRDALIGQLIARLTELDAPNRFLAVVGPSGSGKSSAVRAGLIPALRRGGLPGSECWFIAEMLPGAHPLEQLEQALMKVAINSVEDLIERLKRDPDGLSEVVKSILPADQEAMLIIDQFEELFTLVDDEAVRRHFLDLLLRAVTAPDSRLRVIVTLRADFYDRPLLYEDFGDLFRRRTEVVLPLSSVELVEAIASPARRSGLELETGLIDVIVQDVGDQPGALPLLQYALTELFERRERRMLTLQGYQDSGSITGALAHRAEALYAGLNPREQQAARQLFMRVVTPGDGTEDTRRRVRQAEVTSLSDETGDNGAMSAVIDLYGKHRLLSFDRDPVTRGPTVEVAHEALIRTWDRLRGWLDESREELRLHRRLTAAAAEWTSAGRETSFLASGMKLQQFEEWAAQTRLALNQEERTYLETSVAERARGQAAEAARKQQEARIARRAQNFGRTAVVLAVVGVLAVIATLVAAGQASSAQQQIAVAGQTLTPVGPTLTAVQGALQAGNAQLATAQGRVTAIGGQLVTAQQQIAVAGQTLTPVGPTLTAVQGALQAGNAQLATAQGRVTAIGGQLVTAQQQVVVAGQTLTPVGPTLTAVQNALQAGNVRLATAQGQVAIVGQTLTPVGPTLTAVQNALQAGNVRLATAQGQVAIVGQTLTPVGPTLTAVAVQIDTQLQRVEALRLAAASSMVSQDTYSEKVPAVLLGIRALNTVYTPQGDEALQAALSSAYVKLAVDTGRSGAGTDDVVLFSPDRKTFLITGDGKTALIQDTLTGKVLVTFEGHLVMRAAYSPDGSQIVTTSSGTMAADEQQPDPAVYLWDAATGKVIRQFTGHARFIRSLAFSPDGKTILAGGEDGTAYSWEAATGKARRDFTGHPGEVTTVAYSPDGKIILTGSTGTNAQSWEGHLWDAVSGKELRKLAFTESQEVHTPYSLVDCAAFSPDGSMIATGGADHVARLWNVQSGQEVREFSGHLDAVRSLSFSPNGQSLVTGSTDKTARLWDVQSGRELRVFSVRNFSQATEVASAVFSPDGRYVLTNDHFKVRFWEVASDPALRTLSGLNPSVQRIALSPDGKYILSGDYLGKVQILDSATGQDVRTLAGPTEWIEEVAFSPDGRYALAGSRDKSAWLWETATGKLVRTFTGHTDTVTSVAISPDDKTVLTGGEDKTARLWNVDTGQEVRQLTRDERISGVAFSPDGKRFLTGSIEGVTRLWDTATGQEVLTLSNLGYGGYAGRVAFSPDGKTIVAGNINGSAARWDAETGRKLIEINASSPRGWTLAFSPDGTKVLFGDADDGAARLFDLTTGQQVRSLTGPTGAQTVEAVAFAPDGKTALVWTADGSARLWQTDYHDFITLACSRITRDFDDMNGERSTFGITDSTPTCPQFGTPGTLAMPTPTSPAPASDASQRG